MAANLMEEIRRHLAASGAFGHAGAAAMGIGVLPPGTAIPPHAAAAAAAAFAAAAAAHLGSPPFALLPHPSPAPLPRCTVSGEPVHTFLANNVVWTVPKRYMPLRGLGHGSSGMVVLVNDTQTGAKLAIKRISQVFDDEERAKRCLREVRMLRHFQKQHHVIHLVDMIEPVPPDDAQSAAANPYANFNDLYLVMEFMETDMYKTIYSSNRLTDDHIQYFLYQILCGLHYIHSAGVIHRDLKPSNILLNADCRVKICDFGLARKAKKTESTVLTEYVVTRWYRAPEIICSDGYDDKIDVWAAGCILGELIARKPLFRGNDYVEQVNLIFDILGTPAIDDLKFVTNVDALKYVQGLKPRERVPFGTLFPSANPLAMDLLEKMLQFNPDKRINVEEALRHPYLKKYAAAPDEELPSCPSTIDFSFERQQYTRAQLQELFIEEIHLIKTEHKAQMVAAMLLTPSNIHRLPGQGSNGGGVAAAPQHPTVVVDPSRPSSGDRQHSPGDKSHHSSSSSSSHHHGHHGGHHSSSSSHHSGGGGGSHHSGSSGSSSSSSSHHHHRHHRHHHHLAKVGRGVVLGMEALHLRVDAAPAAAASSTSAANMGPPAARIPVPRAGPSPESAPQTPNAEMDTRSDSTPPTPNRYQ